MFSYDVDHIIQNDDLFGYKLSIAGFYLDDDTFDEIPFLNLQHNVTIVFDGLPLNTTMSYECVYLLSNYTWSTEGCYLSSLSHDNAQCSCNHLS